MKDPFRVVVIGCGGLGSWFVPGLVRSLEYNAPGSTVVLIDGDTYEPKNVERQQFSDIGNKAQIMRKDVAPSVPQTLVIAQAAWLIAEADAKKKKKKGADEEEEAGIAKLTPSMLFEEGDHIFCLVDNFAARKVCFDAARDFQNIDVYTGGNDEALFGSTWHYIRRNGKDLTQHPGFVHDEFNNPPDKNPGAMSCAERAKIDGGTQILAANMGVSAWLLSKVAFYMMGTEEQALASMEMTEIMFDMAKGESTFYDWRIQQEPTEAEVVAAQEELVTTS